MLEPSVTNNLSLKINKCLQNFWSQSPEMNENLGKKRRQTISHIFATLYFKDIVRFVQRIVSYLEPVITSLYWAVAYFHQTETFFFLVVSSCLRIVTIKCRSDGDIFPNPMSITVAPLGGALPGILANPGARRSSSPVVHQSIVLNLCGS